MKTTIANIRIPLNGLAETVYQYGRYLKANFNPADLTESKDETAGGDIRLQVLAGPDFPNPRWRVWEGDSQFDTDHRGYWGASFVPLGVSRKDSMTIARELIGEAQESEAMSE